MGTLSHLRRPAHLFLSLFLFLHFALAASSPGVTRKEFQNPPQEVTYFDDSDVVLATDSEAGAVYRSDDGGVSWATVKDIADGQVLFVQNNPYDNKVAVAIGRKDSHWITKDRGDSWREFELKDSMPSFRSGPLLSFHSSDSDKIILSTRDTNGGFQNIYTKDGFKEHHVLRENSLRCLWAKEHDSFSTGDEKQDHDRALCIVAGTYSSGTDAQRLVISDNFFEDETEPALDGERPVSGIVSIVAAKRFIMAARQTSGTAEMALYVTTDTKKWHRADFGAHQLKEGGYTIMESTNYSLQVDVSTGAWDMPPMGALFTSDSLGYNFVQNEEATNRNRDGFVDFEKVTNIQGIVLVNIVDNVKAVREAAASKKLRTQISYDDGRTFQDVKAGDANLHLHSVTDSPNSGRVFSSPAPGLIMGVGNTGDSLLDYNEGDLWVSDTAGRTWRKALDGAHKYEFGDSGSILVAVYDESPIGKVSYSTNHGKDWQPVFFKDFDIPGDIRARSLTTFPDSTGLKFILRASSGSGDQMKYWLYTLDFSKLGKRECKDDDFERWPAVVDSDGKPKCVMGHVQTFRRRKADADCFVGVKFKDPVPEYRNDECICDRMVDYECDVGFRRSEDRQRCEPTQIRRPGPGACEKGEKTFKDSNGFRRIPGNQCKPGDGKPIDGDIERSCAEAVAPPKQGEITTAFTEFDTDRFREYYYLERSPSSSNQLFGYADETIVAVTLDSAKVFISHDHGKKWNQILKDEGEIYAIYPHKYFNDRVYFIGASDKVHYSASRGKDISSFNAPGRPNSAGLQILRFHPKNEEWLIWTSCAESSSRCKPQAHVTKKNGMDWIALLQAVGDCEFAWREGRPSKKELVFCAQHINEDPDSLMQLVSSDDWFDTRNTPFKDMINFATMSEYIIVAAKEGEDSQFLKVDASIDGVNFADAKFPSSLQVHHSTAYTVLDSSTHSIFLHVTVNSVRGREFGTIIKSNSNGTSYTLSLDNVNRDEKGYVDFEKMLSLEGVAVANVVANAEEVKDGSGKKLQTKITHNDGAQWEFIQPPAKDAEGKNYECAGSPAEKCSLHLHSYTERSDPRDTYSSTSAIGFMFGIGNVGEYLGPKREADTFLSTDGGITWKMAKKGQYQWEFGDQGAILVMVAEEVPTNMLYYSLDEGETWKDFKFSDYEMMVNDISTVPSDTSRNFLLWATSRDRKAVTINVDFSGLANRRCDLVNAGQQGSDYTLFQPKHPFQEDNCLFGHKWQYYRKRPGVDCYNGAKLEDHGVFHRGSNCTCTREDYECDYNFERASDGSCKLVAGRLPTSVDDLCAAHPEADGVWPPSGYRRLPLTTCEGGLELDKSTEPQACPGHEGQFEKKHGVSGAGLFFAITLPLAAAVAAGWWFYRRFEGRFGLGQIRLGESDGPTMGGRRAGGGGGGRDEWTKYPVMVISACAAIIMAIPMVAGLAARTVKGWMPGGRSRAGYGPSYTSRSSFARGRDYSRVGAQDETDLLGEDSDEEL